MRINYEVKGEGTNLVMLHGWGGSSKSLEKLQDMLAHKGFKVYNLDLPGFGESDLPEEALDLNDYVEYLRVFLKDLKITRPILLGHSFGGKVAAAFAIKHKHLVADLILIDASCLRPKNKLKKNLLYYPSKIGGAFFAIPGFKPLKPLMRKLFYKTIVREHDYLQSGPLQETLKNILSEYLDEKIAQITNPTLLIWGEKDSYTPLWMGEKLAELIPGSRLEVVAEATHNLPIKQPGAVAKLIYTFTHH